MRALALTSALILLLPGAAPAQAPARSNCAMTPPVIIASTHIPPPYPALSQALGEEGTTLLRIRIGPDGALADATVEKSSGSPRLDERAASFAKARYRWQPGTLNCKPVEVTTQMTVVWGLPETNRGAKIPVVDIAPNITDFPPAALAREEQGVTVVRLSLSPEGQPAGAAIGISSGSAALDARALDIARSGHAWGTPAADGKPAMVNVVVTWTIPGSETITSVAHNPEWDDIGHPPAAPAPGR